MSISEWPESERPRERLLRNGPQSLADAELLAICLRTGIRGRSAVELARELLARFGSIRALFCAATQDVRATPGMGAAKCAQVLAALELARRSLREELETRGVLNSPREVRDYLGLVLARTDREVFVALMLDAQHRVLASEELFHGTLTQTSVYPREVVKAALRRNAAAVIFAHNHPSGVTEPSHADELLTRSLKSALALVDVQVLDHFIVAGGRILSFAERGLL
ncbi:MAG: DNA repair protein RadC [Burkholderiales bacterium]|nr:DNA repair protein RadC [Burkholderiales bacterium]